MPDSQPANPLITPFAPDLAELSEDPLHTGDGRGGASRAETTLPAAALSSSSPAHCPKAAGSRRGGGGTAGPWTGVGGPAVRGRGVVVESSISSMRGRLRTRMCRAAGEVSGWSSRDSSQST